MDYLIARLSDIFGISEQITQKISNLPTETSHINLTLSIHELPEDEVIFEDCGIGLTVRNLDGDFYIRNFPDMDSDIAKGWMDRLFKTNKVSTPHPGQWQNKQAMNVPSGYQSVQRVCSSQFLCYF